MPGCQECMERKPSVLEHAMFRKTLPVLHGVKAFTFAYVCTSDHVSKEFWEVICARALPPAAEHVTAAPGVLAGMPERVPKP